MMQTQSPTTTAERRLPSRALLASIVESVDDAIITANLDGIITSWNPAAQRMYGYSAEQVVGRPLLMLMAPEQAQEMTGILERVSDGEQVEHLDTVRLRKEGARVSVSLTVSPVRDEEGRVVGASSIERDITERVEVAERLAEASQYARSLIEAGPDPLVTISPGGKITDVNEATANLIGLPRESLIGTAFSDHFTEPERARAGYETAFARGSTSDYPLTVRRQNGQLRHVLYNASVYKGARGDVLGLVATARDVTDRERAEQAHLQDVRHAVLNILEDLDLERAETSTDLRAEVAERKRTERVLQQRTDDLARSNADLEQFAYAASHDLSEPLRAISGPISLLARRYEGRLDDDADEYIAFAVDGCQRMQAIIDGILAYSRVGRVEGTHESVDCNALVQSTLSWLAPTIDATGADISVGELPVVRAEKAQLGQVFLNLLSNALKFVAPGTRPNVAVDAERMGDTWRFSVTDNGIGIDPKYRERIFGKFKRLHGREEFPGTGIGLALVKRIVEQHGGVVGIEDAPLGGSRFWFTLPTSEGTTP